MSFSQFQDRKNKEQSRDTIAYKIRMLRDVANDFDVEDDYELREEHRHSLVYEIMDVLDGGDTVPADLMDAIYEITDNVIWDMGDQAGFIHTCLRHIKHQQHGDEYAPEIRQKLSDQFNRNGVMAFAASQFYSYHKDGLISLNKWGDMVLERMDEMQILQAYYSPDQDITQIYSLDD